MRLRKSPSNADIEKSVFESFSKHFVLPAGEVSFSDRPDVLITDRDGRTIGIEITALLPDKDALGQCANRQNVVEKAHSIFKRKQKDTTAEYNFGFKDTAVIQQVKPLAKKIARTVSGVPMLGNGPVDKQHYQDIHEVLSIHKTGEYEDAAWRVHRIYSTPILSREMLENKITEKEERAKSYKKCDAYWLLCYVNFINPASDIEIINANIPPVVSDVFEKVIVFRTCFNQVRELSVQPSGHHSERREE